jgi:hypothetical protein
LVSKLYSFYWKPCLLNWCYWFDWTYDSKQSVPIIVIIVSLLTVSIVIIVKLIVIIVSIVFSVSLRLPLVIGWLLHLVYPLLQNLLNSVIALYALNASLLLQSMFFIGLIIIFILLNYSSFYSILYYFLLDSPLILSLKNVSLVPIPSFLFKYVTFLVLLICFLILFLHLAMS